MSASTSPRLPWCDACVWQLCRPVCALDQAHQCSASCRRWLLQQFGRRTMLPTDLGPQEQEKKPSSNWATQMQRILPTCGRRTGAGSRSGRTSRRCPAPRRRLRGAASCPLRQHARTHAAQHCVPVCPPQLCAASCRAHHGALCCPAQRDALRCLSLCLGAKRCCRWGEATGCL